MTGSECDAVFDVKVNIKFSISRKQGVDLIMKIQVYLSILIIKWLNKDLILFFFHVIGRLVGEDCLNFDDSRYISSLRKPANYPICYYSFGHRYMPAFYDLHLILQFFVSWLVKTCQSLMIRNIKIATAMWNLLQCLHLVVIRLVSVLSS